MSAANEWAADYATQISVNGRCVHGQLFHDYGPCESCLADAFRAGMSAGRRQALRVVEDWAGKQVYP